MNTATKANDRSIKPYFVESPLIDRKCNGCGKIIPWDQVFTYSEPQDHYLLQSFFHKQCAIDFTHKKQNWFRRLFQ